MDESIWEDDIYEVIEFMGADPRNFGSDWPHIEGMPTPLDYLEEVEDLNSDDLKLVMRDNTRLTTLRTS